tara:strand:+ start:1393 stop:1719 length:327 start_codon:yes stop_codon:yes gene_type:complete
MARQNYFIGGIVGPITKAIGGSIISTLLGGFGGGEQAARGGGSDSAMAFLKMSEDSAAASSQKFAEIKSEGNAAAAKTAAIFEKYVEGMPKEEQEKTKKRLYNASMYG